nr:uncharacterized protein LOC116281044 isoform X2 [Vicugna pacos]
MSQPESPGINSDWPYCLALDSVSIPESTTEVRGTECIDWPRPWLNAPPLGPKAGLASPRSHVFKKMVLLKHIWGPVTTRKGLNTGQQKQQMSRAASRTPHFPNVPPSSLFSLAPCVTHLGLSSPAGSPWGPAPHLLPFHDCACSQGDFIRPTGKGEAGQDQGITSQDGRFGTISYWKREHTVGCEDCIEDVTAGAPVTMLDHTDESLA